MGSKLDLGALNRNDGRIAPERIGLAKASTFPGFCNRHDSQTFAPIELADIEPTTEQAFLLAYRAICMELFKKLGQMDLATGIMVDADRGLSLRDQMMFQEWRSNYLTGIKLGVRDLSGEKELYDRILQTRTWDQSICYIAVATSCSPTIASTGAIIPECDFLGNELAPLGRPEKNCDLLAFSIIARENGGLAIWACRSDSKYGMAFLRTASSMSDDELVQGAARFAFEFVENTYISPEWWYGLPKDSQETIIGRLNSGLFDDPGPRRIVDDGIQLVNWTPGNRVERLASIGG